MPPISVKGLSALACGWSVYCAGHIASGPPIPGGPEKAFPTLRSYFQEFFLGMKVIFCRCIEYLI